EGVVDEDAPRFGWIVGTDRVAGGRIRLAPPELVDQLRAARGPDGLVLAPRRQLRHVNSQFIPMARVDGPDILVNPDDAAARALADGEWARVRSAHGEVTGRVRIDPGLLAGTVSIPHG